MDQPKLTVHTEPFALIMALAAQLSELNIDHGKKDELMSYVHELIEDLHKSHRKTEQMEAVQKMYQKIESLKIEKP